MKIQTITEHGIIMLVVFTMMGIGLSFAVHAEETNTTILEAIQEVVVDSGETPVTEEIVVGQAPITEEVTPVTEEQQGIHESGEIVVEQAPITEEVTPVTEETNTTILEAIQEVVVDSGETPVTEEIVVGQAPITEEVTPITEEVVQPTIIISNYNSNDTLQSSSINPPTQVIADFIKSILG